MGEDDIFGEIPQPVAPAPVSVPIELVAIPANVVSEATVVKAPEDLPLADASEALTLSAPKRKDLPYLMKIEGIPEDFKNMADRLVAQYEHLPVLDYDEIYRELGQLSVHSSPTPTLDVINAELEKVQSARDRLSEIYVNIVINLEVKKRVVDSLQTAWGNFSQGKSAEKRKGEASFLISLFEADLSQVSAVFKAVDVIYGNLEAIYNTLRTKVSVIQSQIRTFDVGRGNMPDINFDKLKGDMDIAAITSKFDTSADGTLPETLFDSGKQVEV